MYTPDNNTTITKGDSPKRLALKRQLISTFESMLSVGKFEILKFWKRVFKIEKSLSKELSQSIREIEKRMKK